MSLPSGLRRVATDHQGLKNEFLKRGFYLAKRKKKKKSFILPCSPRALLAFISLLGWGDKAPGTSLLQLGFGSPLAGSKLKPLFRGPLGSEPSGIPVVFS